MLFQSFRAMSRELHSPLRAAPRSSRQRATTGTEHGSSMTRPGTASAGRPPLSIPRKSSPTRISPWHRWYVILPSPSRGSAYTSRHPQSSVLYEVVSECLEGFRAARGCDRDRVPLFVGRTFGDYLTCGLPSTASFAFTASAGTRARASVPVGARRAGRSRRPPCVARTWATALRTRRSTAASRWSPATW